VLGHEYSGTIVETGKDVAGFDVGDRVVVDPNVVDDTCFFCRRGQSHLCSGLSPLGVVRPGGFAELSAVPARYLYKIPDGVSLSEAALIEPLACCIRGIDQAQVSAGDVVLILGAGPIGCFLIQLARMSGAAVVISVEPAASRHEFASRAGADLVCHPLEAAKVLNLVAARKFALRSLDRVLAEAWKQVVGLHAEGGESARATQASQASSAHELLHVVSYSDPKAEHREIAGLLEDYAFTALACLDAYEATSDLSYFKFAQAIADAMIARFFDATSGGFFDSEPSADGKNLGVLATRRKPLQDSPTPAGNPMAAIALVRLHHYTGDAGYRDKAEQTLETFAGVVEQFGIFAATYGIAVVHLLESPVQVVVIAEDTDNKLYAEVVAPFAFNKTALRFTRSQAVAQNLPPVLAATIPQLPQLASGGSFAVLCSGSTCQPPITDAAELREALGEAVGIAQTK